MTRKSARPVDIIRAGKALIMDPAKWTKDVAARSANLVPVDVFSEDACSFCSFGAIMRAAGQRMTDAYHARCAAQDQLDDQHYMTVAVNLLSDAFGGSIGKNNDMLSHPEVLELWDHAIRLAEQYEERMK